MAKTEKLTFQLDQGETESFYVLEQTRLGGVDYILVAVAGVFENMLEDVEFT